MPRSRQLVPGWLLSGSLVCGGLVSAAIAPRVADAGLAPEAVVHQHTTVTGETGFALGVKADRPMTADSIHHVILIDTSASQIGEHREHALEVLDQVLASLPATDRVQVMAYDVEPVALTRGFVSPETAVNITAPKLARRVPAGAGNLLDALKSAKNALSGHDATAVTLIGDGMSVAKLMRPADMQSSLSALRKQNTAVNTYGVGSNVDHNVLGILAQQTGGFALVDKNGSAEDVGYRLAQASRELPTSVASLRLGDTDGELLSSPLPLRSDRMTFVVGIGEIATGDTVEVTTPDNGAQRASVKSVSTDGNEFLVAEVGKLERYGDVLNGLAGENFIAQSRQRYFDQVDALEQSGMIALEAGNSQKAEIIASQLAAIDPGNRRANELLEAASMKMIPVMQADDLAAPDADAPTAPSFELGDKMPSREQERQLDPISEVEELVRLKGEKLSLETNRAIRDARAVLATDTDSARSILEQIRGAVKSASDVEPELQERLLRRLNYELSAVESKDESLTAERQSQQEMRAETESQQRLVESLVLEEDRLKQLSEQVRALMAQGYAGESNAFEEAEAVARVIVSLRPGNATGQAGLFNAEAAGQLDKAFRLRSVRADQFLATLYQVELSHIPFPDEPPVVYPSAAEWQRKTEMREKWRSVDLHQNSPNEARIAKALDQDVNFTFVDTPLGDAITFIGETYDIPIEIKDDSLSELGVSVDDTFTLVISGVKLRNAMNIILRDKIRDLTYYVKDEVLWISTVDDANATGVQTRVYPVADLVIPLTPPQGGGGGIQGGGQQGGQGGGFGGGGQGGQGGGFFSVPSGDVEGKKKAVK